MRLGDLPFLTESGMVVLAISSPGAPLGEFVVFDAFAGDLPIRDLPAVQDMALSLIIQCALALRCNSMD